MLKIYQNINLVTSLLDTSRVIIPGGAPYGEAIARDILNFKFGFGGGKGCIFLLSFVDEIADSSSSLPFSFKKINSLYFFQDGIK